MKRKARIPGGGASRAAPPAEPVLEAVGVLREMNEKGKRKVSDDAPRDFVKPHWERHVSSEDGIDKPLYEMGAIIELNNALRSGDVWVPGSRHYADFKDSLLPRERWKDIKTTVGPPVATNPDLDEYLAQRSEELHREPATVNRMISRGKLQNARVVDGGLKSSRDKTSIPKVMKEFTQKVYEQMLRVRLADLLVEVAPGPASRSTSPMKTGEPAKDLEPILAAILADGINLVLSKMAGASAVS